VATPLHRRAAQLRQSLSPSRAHLVLEQAELRARGRAKFAASDRLYFTRRGLEQATDQWIAAHKARRFPAGRAVADLCCGIGGDLLALAARGPADGFDLDPLIGLFADANVRTLPQQAPAASRAHSMDAGRVDLSAYAAWHIDPDRRCGGRRTIDVRRMSPGRETIERLLDYNEDAAVKLAPATSPPHSWQERAELEWISRDRQCRQLVAWFGRLAGLPAARRATVLDVHGQVVASVTGTPQHLPPPASAVLDYVFEPDASILAAGLAGQLAEAHKILPLAPSIPYFTGAEPIHDPALAAFRVLGVLPADEKRLAAELRTRRIGRLEIKCRGGILPEAIRKRLRLKGDLSGVLLVAPHKNQTIAVLAERMERKQSVVSSQFTVATDTRPLTSDL
jgi:hypothetical protein